MVDATITGKAYSEALGGAHSVLMLARTVQGQFDLDAAIAAIDEADAVGSIVAPTLYRDRATAMLEDRQILVAVRDLGRLSILTTAADARDERRDREEASS